MPDEDWRKKIDDAADAAKKKADAAVQDDLDKITAQAAELQEIFDGLKLTDAATYDQLVEIVDEATARNDAISSVVDRVKALGAAGKELAATIGNISGGGALAMLRNALKLPPA